MFIVISVGSPPPFEPSDLPCLPEFRISNEDFPACNFLDGCSKTFAIGFEQIFVIFLVLLITMRARYSRIIENPLNN